MATLIKQFSFVAATTIQPNQVNANFDDIYSFINNELIHKDGSRAMTAHLELVASDPASANQAARKAYVDAQIGTRATNDAVTTAQNSANTALDRVPNKVRWGQVSGVTNGAGDIFFAHGLGGTPSSVVITAASTGATNVWKGVVENRDGVNVNLRVYNTTNGAALPGTGVTFFWFAAL